jgi:hypothetical protein
MIHNLPYELKHLLAKNKATDLNTKLIETDADIPLRYEYYKKHQDPRTISNYLLYALSSTILNINESFKKAGVNIAHDLTLYIIKNILDSEKLLAKPDLVKFNMAVIAVTNDDMLDTAILSDDDDVQTGYVSEAESEKSLMELGDSDVDNEFDTGDLDIETDEEENLLGNPMDF